MSLLNNKNIAIKVCHAMQECQPFVSALTLILVVENFQLFICLDLILFNFDSFLLSVCSVSPSDDEDQQEKTLSQVYDRLPEGRSPLDILKSKDERESIGKSERIGLAQQTAEEDNRTP